VCNNLIIELNFKTYITETSQSRFARYTRHPVAYLRGTRGKFPQAALFRGQQIFEGAFFSKTELH